MNKMHKANIFLYSSLFSGITLFIILLQRFNYAELGPATEITLKFFAVPALMTTIIFFTIPYIKGAREQKDNLAILRGLALSISVGISLVLFVLSSAVFLNVILGDGKDMTLKGKVTYYSYTVKRGVPEHFIKVKADSFDRIFDMHVNTAYEVGDPFERTVKIGRFGWLYSR